jgi:prevent-host-death family protein
MKVVTARKAIQAFSRLLADVEGGQEVVITKRGRAVAQVIPLPGPLPTAKREMAVRRVLALARKRKPLGRMRFTRDEMHER